MNPSARPSFSELVVSFQDELDQLQANSDAPRPCSSDVGSLFSSANAPISSENTVPPDYKSSSLTSTPDQNRRTSFYVSTSRASVLPTSSATYPGQDGEKGSSTDTAAHGNAALPVPSDDGGIGENVISRQIAETNAITETEFGLAVNALASKDTHAQATSMFPGNPSLPTQPLLTRAATRKDPPAGADGYPHSNQSRPGNGGISSGHASRGPRAPLSQRDQSQQGVSQRVRPQLRLGRTAGVSSSEYNTLITLPTPILSLPVRGYEGLTATSIRLANNYETPELVLGDPGAGSSSPFPELQHRHHDQARPCTSPTIQYEQVAKIDIRNISSNCTSGLYECIPPTDTSAIQPFARNRFDDALGAGTRSQDGVLRHGERSSVGVHGVQDDAAEDGAGARLDLELMSGQCTMGVGPADLTYERTLASDDAVSSGGTANVPHDVVLQKAAVATLRASEGHAVLRKAAAATMIASQQHSCTNATSDVVEAHTTSAAPDLQLRSDVRGTGVTEQSKVVVAEYSRQIEGTNIITMFRKTNDAGLNFLNEAPPPPPPPPSASLTSHAAPTFVPDPTPRRSEAPDSVAPPREDADLAPGSRPSESFVNTSSRVRYIDLTEPRRGSSAGARRGSEDMCSLGLDGRRNNSSAVSLAFSDVEDPGLFSVGSLITFAPRRSSDMVFEHDQ